MQRFSPVLSVVFAATLLACSSSTPNEPEKARPNPTPAPAKSAPGEHKIATFAGGCFWCMEAPFDQLDGVFSTTSGYIGGHKDNPTYKQVSAGTTGHTEAVEIVFDPKKITYEKLLEVFWHNIDPLAKNRQFCDAGTQYRSGIFYHDDKQKAAAEKSKQALVDGKVLDGEIHTEITAASKFYPAEDYHQDYYKKNPFNYKRYRFGCGRDRRLKELWGDKAAH